jgi:hypothetical protein
MKKKKKKALTRRHLLTSAHLFHTENAIDINTVPSDQDQTLPRVTLISALDDWLVIYSSLEWLKRARKKRSGKA